MGYCIELEEGSIKIKKENMESALKKLSNYFTSGGNLTWVNGFDIKDMVAEDEFDEPLELEEIWDDLRYGYEITETHYIINEFLGEKYGDDNKLFELIASYCEDGYLQFCGEDGDHFRFVIEDGKFSEKQSTLIWE